MNFGPPWLWRGAGLLVGLAVLGLLFLWSGIIRIPASTGHWDITAWTLHFAMRQSVRTWSAGITPPADLDAPYRVRIGAGHYATGCAPCHGAPGEAPSAITEQMTPHPPTLGSKIPRWTDDELFYVVRHGIKYTGMPAWPVAHRDDEVWSMVAFLRQLPELPAADYRNLAHGEPDLPIAGLPPLSDPQPLPALADCARCHGRDGAGRGQQAFPRLDLHHEPYLREALMSYARGERTSGIMQAATDGLDGSTLDALARHYAGAPLTAAAVAGTAAAERGRAIALHGLPEQRVPACAHCHGPDRTADNPLFPHLAGQPAWYLKTQLELFREGHRGGGRYAPVMTQVAKALKPQQIDDLAAFYSGSAHQDTAR